MIPLPVLFLLMLVFTIIQWVFIIQAEKHNNSGFGLAGMTMNTIALATAIYTGVQHW